MSQTTNTLLMIRPVQFRLNEQTAIDNFYQKSIENTDPSIVNAKAVKEFDGLVKKLEAVGVQVIVVNDTKEFDTPDSIFPNNWISFHSKKRIAIYPMYAKNRRLERNDKIIKFIESKGIEIDFINDYSEAENHNLFLEGTGSMVLDRLNKKSYCSLSERTSESLVEEFCDEFNYMPIIFKSYQSIDKERKLIYHTNVMMCLGDAFSLICLESIESLSEQKKLKEAAKTAAIGGDYAGATSLVNKAMVPETMTNMAMMLVTLSFR